jgi:hypothetical protein
MLIDIYIHTYTYHDYHGSNTYTSTSTCTYTCAYAYRHSSSTGPIRQKVLGQPLQVLIKLQCPGLGAIRPHDPKVARVFPRCPWRLLDWYEICFGVIWNIFYGLIWNKELLGIY